MSEVARMEKVLRDSKPYLLERFRVKEIGIFGSFARDEADGSSDVDILVEFEEPIGWDVLDLREYLEGILGRKVDVVSRKALKPALSEGILREVIFA